MAYTFGLLVATGLSLTLFTFLMWLVGARARDKGRDPIPWVLLAFVISPFLALLLIALLPPLNGPGGGWGTPA